MCAVQYLITKSHHHHYLLLTNLLSTPFSQILPFLNVATIVGSATMNVLPHEIALKSSHPSGGGSTATTNSTSSTATLFRDQRDQGLAGLGVRSNTTTVTKGVGGVTAVGVTSAASGGLKTANLNTSNLPVKSGAKSESAKQQLQMWVPLCNLLLSIIMLLQSLCQQNFWLQHVN